MNLKYKKIGYLGICLNLFLTGLATGCKENTPLPVVETDPYGLPPIEKGPYVLDIPSYFSRQFTIPADNPLTKEGVQLGRLLFYEKKLSGDNTMSCSSCHEQKKAFSDNLAFSKGIAGKPGRRSSMALVNLLWVRHLFWDGRAGSLEEQALVPIQDPLELHQPLDQAVVKLQATPYYPERFEAAFGTPVVTAENIAKALAQFQRTLISADSRYDRHLQKTYQVTAQEQKGIDLFFTHPVAVAGLRGANCGDCHGSHLTTLNTFHNNGLDASPTDLGRELFTKRPTDRGKFRAPSLRNIALTAPYMHDGRFKTLEEVLDHYNEHIQGIATLDPLIQEATNDLGGRSLLLTEQEKKDVIAFLHMLTDSTFITDSKFSNPFSK